MLKTIFADPAYAGHASDAYKAAYELCQTKMDPPHPIRLGLALNYSVFYFEIMEEHSKACEIAKNVSCSFTLTKCKTELVSRATLVADSLALPMLDLRCPEPVSNRFVLNRIMDASKAPSSHVLAETLYSTESFSALPDRKPFRSFRCCPTAGFIFSVIFRSWTEIFLK